MNSLNSPEWNNFSENISILKNWPPKEQDCIGLVDVTLQMLSEQITTPPEIKTIYRVSVTPGFW